MKNIILEINKKSQISNLKSQILLWVFILAYIIYFSYFTILRYKTLYASYFDLGIMHQTVYNSYMAIKTGGWSRFLELTNPEGSDQIKRIAIHNDVLLGLLAPFYFIYPGPETLLIIQTIILAAGALAVYLLTKKILANNFLALIFSLSYLLYSPMERANIFDFHAVILSTTFLLFMFYFWLVKRYWLSIFFLILSLISKEQVGLTTAFFGLYIIFTYKGLATKQPLRLLSFKPWIFGLVIFLVSVIWFVLSIFVIIPYFRGQMHFGLKYYEDFGSGSIFHIDTFRYFLFLLGPLGFLSFLSPAQLLIAAPEFAINLLSNNWNMRNIIYHYTSVIQPWVFISGIYGVKMLLSLRAQAKQSLFMRLPRPPTFVGVLAMTLLLTSLGLSYFKGPLPYSREAEIHPFTYPQKEAKDAMFWANVLKDEKLKISSTGQLAPFFTSRRYFYIFSDRYQLADYVAIRLNEIYNYPEKNQLIPVYEKLTKDKKFQLIYQRENFEVYKKI